jgi:hypothetical protein
MAGNAMAVFWREHFHFTAEAREELMSAALHAGNALREEASIENNGKRWLQGEARDVFGHEENISGRGLNTGTAGSGSMEMR